MMLATISALRPVSALLPESTLHTDVFAILAAFVAINTVIYGALAVAKVLPKTYVSDWIHRSNRRAQTRSIHPDADSEVTTPGPSTGAVSYPE